MAQSRCDFRYFLEWIPSSFIVPLLFSNSKWKIHWNRYGCTWIGNLWRPRLQAPKPFLQRCMFQCFPFPPMAFHFYYITFFFWFIYLPFFFQLEICNLSVKVWHTASLYHLVHTAALVAAPITKNPNVVSSHFSISLLDFSFSYILSVCNVTI